MRFAVGKAINAGVVSVAVTREYILSKFLKASIALYGFLSCESGAKSNQVSFVTIARGQIMHFDTSSSSQGCSCFFDVFLDM